MRQLVRGEFFVILRATETNRGRVDVVRLHDDFAGRIGTTCATRRLRYQRETNFRRTKVRQAQRRVRVQNADRRHVADVVTFGDHLRAEQDVVIAACEGVQNLLVTELAARGVSVHAKNPRRRERIFQRDFKLFRADAQELNFVGAAFGTLARRIGFAFAVVATNFPVDVVSDGQAAFGALDDGAARSTHDDG